MLIVEKDGVFWKTSSRRSTVFTIGKVTKVAEAALRINKSWAIVTLNITNAFDFVRSTKTIESSTKLGAPIYSWKGYRDMIRTMDLIRIGQPAVFHKNQSWIL